MSAASTPRSAEPADLILLDVMLPKINGYEICRAVRAQGIDVPIVMLTAKGQEQDVILGLNLGADDYVTKPFRMGELIARVRRSCAAGVRRATCFRFGDCEVDLRARKVPARGREIELTAKEFPLLAYFGTRPGARSRATSSSTRCGERGLRDAAQHRPVRRDAAREDRAGSASPDLHSHDPRYRLSLRARRRDP